MHSYTYVHTSYSAGMSLTQCKLQDLKRHFQLPCISGNIYNKNWSTPHCFSILASCQFHRLGYRSKSYPSIALEVLYPVPQHTAIPNRLERGSHLVRNNDNNFHSPAGKKEGELPFDGQYVVTRLYSTTH